MLEVGGILVAAVARIHHVLSAGLQDKCLSTVDRKICALSQKEPKATTSSKPSLSLPPLFSEDLGVGSAVALAKAISMKPKKEKK